MFNRERPPRKTTTPNKDTQDVLGQILADEIRAELATFRQTSEQEIATANQESDLTRIENKIDEFVEKLTQKASPIWDQSLLAKTYEQIQATIDHLSIKLNEKREQWRREEQRKMEVAIADKSRREAVADEYWERDETQEILTRFQTLFPNKDLETSVLVIGGKSKDQLINELREAGVLLKDNAVNMMDGKQFATNQKLEPILLVKLSLKDLGFTERQDLEQILDRAKKLGLELCPAEVGPHLRLAYTNQPLNEWLCVGMEPIATSTFDYVLALNRDNDGLKLYNDYSNNWRPDGEFVFRLRK